MLQAGVYHFAIAGLGFCLIGAAAHATRAIFNVLPDRLSDNDRMDMILSDGYSLGDKIFGTEYDDAGYYRLDSLRNLKNSVAATLIGGWAAMLLTPGLSASIARGVEWAEDWLWDLFLHRLETLTLW
ncbi:hypothetical protein [Rhizobium sp. TRM95796]|uniref:hypothetical protein n=1 Tax=Rhizobium sp. TRM95796 TaxID=2979862 RepID=UPI0021E700A6|nr:hypothetical protein [Rhizobium sp. TRM95796]MCV3764827.1 hypothetical protein [Rhizobium sp. TRM95796]